MRIWILRTVICRSGRCQCSAAERSGTPANQKAGGESSSDLSAANGTVDELQFSNQNQVPQGRAAPKSTIRERRSKTVFVVASNGQPIGRIDAGNSARRSIRGGVRKRVRRFDKIRRRLHQAVGISTQNLFGWTAKAASRSRVSARSRTVAADGAAADYLRSRRCRVVSGGTSMSVRTRGRGSRRSRSIDTLHMESESPFTRGAAKMRKKADSVPALIRRPHNSPALGIVWASRSWPLGEWSTDRGRMEKLASQWSSNHGRRKITGGSPAVNGRPIRPTAVPWT